MLTWFEAQMIVLITTLHFHKLLDDLAGYYKVTLVGQVLDAYACQVFYEHTR